MLHALAQGGWIKPLKNQNGRIISVECYTREGWRMPQIELIIFKKLQHKKAIKSQGGHPYRITQRGLELVRAEFTNR